MTPCRIEDVLASEGVYAATTWGTSMYPMLRSGRDTVILRPPQGRLRCYDVPLYRVGEKYVLHRVIRVLPEGYLIRGDNCLTTERCRRARSSACLPASTATTVRWTCPAPATGCTAASGAPCRRCGGSIAASAAPPLLCFAVCIKNALRIDRRAFFRCTFSSPGCKGPLPRPAPRRTPQTGPPTGLPPSP